MNTDENTDENTANGNTRITRSVMMISLIGALSSFALNPYLKNNQ